LEKFWLNEGIFGILVKTRVKPVIQTGKLESGIEIGFENDCTNFLLPYRMGWFCGYF
jgi:hypothetical protein